MYSSHGVPLTNVGFLMLALNAREREGVIFVDAEAEMSLGLSDSGSTFARKQRPRKDATFVQRPRARYQS